MISWHQLRPPRIASSRLLEDSVAVYIAAQALGLVQGRTKNCDASVSASGGVSYCGIFANQGGVVL